MAIDDRRKNFPLDELLECKMNGITVIDVFTFFEREFGKIRLDMLQPSHLIFSEGFQHNTLYPYAKRLFDLTFSLLLLAIAWPVMAVTALAILMEDGWKASILYRQVRVGQDGKLFTILIFRNRASPSQGRH